MSFPSFLRELGQLIQERAVISCTHPRLVAMDTVNELAGLTCAHPGLITSSGAAVRSHLERHPAKAILFISEHLQDGPGLALIREINLRDSSHRSVLILTDNHDHSVQTLQDPALAAVVLDQNIGGPTCVLTKALAAVNHGERFVDPAISIGAKTDVTMERLSDREREVLSLVADGLSNKEVAERLHLASTTVRDHMQSVMRKLQVSSRTGAAVAGVRQGLLAG